MAGDAVDAFVDASLGDLDAALAMLAADPGLPGSSPTAAVVVGDARRVAAHVASDPSWVAEPDEARGWPPLLYAGYSLWYRAGRREEDGLLAVARLLLDAGASPDAHNGRLPNRGYRSALHGSAVGGNVGMCRLLLERGANPDDRCSLRDAVEAGRRGCVAALLAHGATVERTWAPEAAASVGDHESLGLLLAAIDGAERRRAAATDALAYGVDGRCLDTPAAAAVVGVLLAAGADPDGAPDEAPPARTAARAGRPDIAAQLAAAGAAYTVTDVDRLIGACWTGDADAARRLLASVPDLAECVVTTEPAALIDVAGRPSPDGVAVERAGVWLEAPKAPSPAVAAVLREHAVEPGAEAPPDATTPGADPPPGDPALPRLAAALREAYEAADLGALGELLDPDVRFGGGPLACRGRAEVVDRFAWMVQRGFTGRVTRGEIVGGAIVLVVDVGGDERVQRFDVVDGLIVTISGHDDVAAARRAPLPG